MDWKRKLSIQSDNDLGDFDQMPAKGVASDMENEFQLEIYFYDNDNDADADELHNAHRGCIRC